MTGSVATVNGDIKLSFGPLKGNNLNSLQMTRTTWNVPDPANVTRVCAATMSISPNMTFITDDSVSFHYTMTDCQGGTWYGGANLAKVAGTN
jgi:hypothetical protein